MILNEKQNLPHHHNSSETQLVEKWQQKKKKKKKWQIDIPDIQIHDCSVS